MKACIEEYKSYVVILQESKKELVHICLIRSMVGRNSRNGVLIRASHHVAHLRVYHRRRRVPVSLYKD